MADEFELIRDAWVYIVNCLDTVFVSKQLLQSSIANDASLWRAVELIERQCDSRLIEASVLDRIKENLRDEIVPRFWAHFDRQCSSESAAVQLVKLAVTEFRDSLQLLDPAIEIVQSIRDRADDKNARTESFLDVIKLTYKGLLLSQISLNYDSVMRLFYSIAFKAFLKNKSIQDGAEIDDEMLTCQGCGRESENCDCREVLLDFHDVNSSLIDLELIERLSGDALTTVIHEHVEEHIKNTCKGSFETSYLPSIEKWLNNVVVDWLSTVFYGKVDPNTNLSLQHKSAVDTFTGRLLHFMYKTYAKTRMEELFNIIIEFPESQPAIDDLKACLTKTDLRAKLVESLKSALETRLLHPGVNTNDILIAYTSAIKTLWALDPTGVLLDQVCEPVHKYLRTRQDAVRCIVSSLTDDTSGELADELNKGEPLVLEDSYVSDDDSDNWETWKPDPIDGNPEKMSKNRRTLDIISMLVNIYGSKDLFIKEYSALLANRILIQFKYDIQRELRYLELLKLRFGEANLHLCEVMLKDVADSKRINTHICMHAEEAKTPAEDFEVSAIILSAQFWPSLREERLQLPAPILSALDTYTKAFETLKGNRTLNWKPHLGLVSLEVEVKDRLLELQVAPIHATILFHFEKQAQWTLDALASVLQVPATLLKRKMAFWQSHGLIRESAKNVFELTEEPQPTEGEEGAASAAMMVDEDDEDAESAMASVHEQREEEMQVFWSYIVGMLTNLDSLPLERIHSMLKMFVIQSPTALECSLQELRTFLDQKVKEQKLHVTTGLYRLPKPNK